MQLRASKTEQKSIIQDTCEERERLWNLQVESEAQLDDYFRSAELLRQEVESQERELQELRAALASGFAGEWTQTLGQDLTAVFIITSAPCLFFMMVL